ncbi:MAG: glycine oxidase ThiO [Solirubrobacterales bacterium]
MQIHNPNGSDRDFDAVVIGAGVIGLSIGWRAAQAGLSVCVVDREGPGGGASSVAGGMLAPVTEADFGERELIELNLEGAARYPAFVVELQEATGIDIDYRSCGTIAVATDRDELEMLERLHSLQRSLGLEAERLSAREARVLEPGLTPHVAGAVHAPGDHRVSPRALVEALRAAFEREGGWLRSAEGVKRVVFAGDAVIGVELDSGERIAAPQVVIAAGPWSGRVAGLPDDVNVQVRPVKGQILRLRGSAETPLAARVIRAPGVYVVPRSDGRMVVGATVEEQGFDRTVTAGAVFELLRRAYDVLPGVAELELVQASAGLRPATPDNRPVLGHGARTGLVWATGHWRNGILLAPLTGDAIAGLLGGTSLSDSLAPFAPGRVETAGAAR